MEREAPFIFLIASCSLRFPKQVSWNVFGSQSLPQAPGRSARFARCARSLARCARLTVVSFRLSFIAFSNFLLICEVVSISVDLSWIFMPTWLHVGLIFRLLGRLGASWGPLEPSWERLGGILWRLSSVLGGLGPSWGVLGASWARLGKLKNLIFHWFFQCFCVPRPHWHILPQLPS